MHKAVLAIGIVAAMSVVASSCGSETRRQAASCDLPGFAAGSAYVPRIDPKAFSADVDNAWFPLRPGRTLVYSGRKDGAAAMEVLTTTRRTKRVDGVATRVVEDRLYLDGRLHERTTDYYAQDACGNVWYFGEDTAELDEHGKVASRSGSFHAGTAGAQAGVFMQARPESGRRFRQEWFRGEAEDTYKAVDLNAATTVPYGSFRGALRTEETTALEPGVLDNKVYVRGLGTVAEISVRGSRERLELVDVIE